MQRQEPGAPKKFHNYRDMLKDMGQISTVEQYFQYFVYMKKPTEIPREIDLFFFREGEIPMWEVSGFIRFTLKESPNGGIWITKIKKDDNVNKMWESLLLALICKGLLLLSIRRELRGAPRHWHGLVSANQGASSRGLA